MSSRASLPPSAVESGLVVVMLALGAGCSGTSEAPSPGGDQGAGGGAGVACAAGEIVNPLGECIPVGIQGCADAFLEADGLCHPRIDKCPAGSIPKLDQGCIDVGIPRSRCADIFVGDDEICRPTMEACAGRPGTFPVPSEGCVPIDGPDGCGAGTWGNLSAEPGTIHVDPSAAPGGDGSRSAPVQSIADALALASDGGRIALAAGTYEEGVEIGKSIELAGRCASMVRIQGSTSQLSRPATVRIEDMVQVHLRGLSIGSAGAIGVSAASGAEITAEWVHVRGAGIAGVAASTPGTTVSLHHTLVEDTDGPGVFIEGGARGEIASSAVVGNALSGIAAVGPGAEVTIASCTVTRTKASAGGFPGVLAQGAKLTVRESAVTRNQTVGLIAMEGGELVATSNTVSDNANASAEGPPGIGVVAQPGARISLVNNAIIANEYLGVRAMGPGGAVDSAGDLIALTRPAKSGAGGLGCMIEEGATMTLAGSSLVRNRAVGANVVGAGATLSVEGSLIEGTQPEASSNTFGYGVQLRGGARLALMRSAVVGNGTAGILLNDGARGAEITASLIEATAPEASRGVFGRGIAAQRSDELTVDASVISGNVELGIVVGEIADASITRTLVQDTLPQESDGTYGGGLFALATKVRIADSTFRRNHAIAIGVQDGTSDIQRVIVDSVAAGLVPTGNATVLVHAGDGMMQLATKVAISDTRVHGAARAGLLFDACAGEIVRTSSTQNAYGLVRQGSVRPTLGEGNVFEDNTEANVIDDRDLAIPNEPPQSP